MADESPTIQPTQVPNGARRRIQASTMLLAEWLALYHRGATVFYEHRLGPTIQTVIMATVTPAQERMLRRSNAYADALVVENAQLLVVEAGVVANAGKISQVLYYARLIPQTADLGDLRALPIAPIVLSGTNNPVISAMANEQGVQFVVYSPTWISAYLSGYYGNKNAAVQT